MYSIATDKLSQLFAEIDEKCALYVPCENNGTSEYMMWSEESVICEELNTSKPAKSLFFPQSETLAGFKMSGKSIEIYEKEKASEEFVVYGVRACDAQSIENVLDKVFLSAPVDEFYKARRDHGTIITSACCEPEETCFCTVFGIDPSDCRYGDVTSWTDGGMTYFRANTDKGAALLESLSCLDKADDNAADGVIAKSREIMAQLPLAQLSLEGWGAGKTEEKFSSPKWEELAKGCIGCGTCTFVCPTCQCYDIRDFDTGHGVQRYRCWDSCMYSDFTLMAHGNSRKTQTERFRQRFMHKLVYFPDNNNGDFSCVGCGRCLAKCPVSKNIVKVIKSI